MLAPARLGLAKQAGQRTNSVLAWLTVTAGAVANTKTATWTEVEDSTPIETHMLVIWAENSQAASVDSSMLADIAVGGATQEVVLINNLACGNLYPGGESGSSRPPRYWFVPVYIPAGSRISVKLQAAVALDTCRFAFDYYGYPQAGGWLQGGGIDTYGANTGTSKGVLPTANATIHTKGAWAEVGTLLVPTKGLFVSPNGQDNALNSGSQLTDIGVCPAGGTLSTDTVVIIPDIPTTTDTNDGIGTSHYLGAFPLGFSLKKDDRLAVRCQSITASEAKINWCVYGVR